ncbi:ABC transporter superfamily protein [Abortiporus biennis]
MSDHEVQEKVAELPASPSIGGHHHHHGEHRNPLTRHVSRASSTHVDVGFFDPAGVGELRRTMSRMSAEPSQVPLPATPRPTTSNSTTESSGDTLAEENNADFDFEKILRDVMRQADESEIQRRELGVLFKDLRVVGLGSTARHQSTFGSVLNPFHVLQSIHALRHPPLRDILSGFEGVVRPGEMLLVLGRPGAGCSTLLRTLANQRHEYYAIEGDVHYDSFTPQEIEKHYRGDVQYCPEDDIHFPTLTVEETLTFAAKTRTPHTRIGGETREQHVARVVGILSTIFGLNHVKDTLVGDASIRGVSGGEKKRVSIAESMATLSRLSSWDNSTRGLDASTALEFVQALRIATDVARGTTLVSIYQAGESLYELFDKVCVIYEGKMAYFGPAKQARQYFIDMGFEPANRQTTADFLVAITDPNGRIVRSGFENRTPRTAIEFADAFKKSDLGRANQEDMDSYRYEFVGKKEIASNYRNSVIAAHAKHVNPKSSFITSIPMQARALMVRRVQIMKGGYAAQIIHLSTFVIQAVIIGTVFVRLPASTSTFYSRGGVIFFALLFAALTSMAEIPALFTQRPIVLRQSRAAMYHPFVDSLSLTLVDAPMTAITLIVFSLILYFVVGLQQEAGKYFIFLLFLFSMTITMKAWFRGLAAIFSDAAPAQSVAGLSILLLVLYTGYTIPQPTMIGGLRWITWIDPLRYGFEALMVNEFHTFVAECGSIIPQGPGYENVSAANQVCTTVGSEPGQTLVNGYRYVQLSFKYTFSHLWRNFGIVWTFGFGFIGLYLLFTEINKGHSADSAAVEFKRGTNTQDIKASAGDEEKQADSTLPTSQAEKQASLNDAAAAAPAMTDVFLWQHLDYVIPVGHNHTRKLLDDISGYVAPGKLTALMGESGAGKTTLLNALAQRTSTGVIHGDRFVNGHPLPSDFQAQTGYCQQMDTHLETTTVREALLFSAKLRQPASVPMSEKEAYVDQCLKMCGLSDYAEAIVGSLGVEHRKRTTIGVELAAKPRLLLFLDEPTSGLDSQSAWAIMSFLRSLADNGQAILCTIHQPSAELFETFDRLLLLRRGGQTVYFGDIGYHSETMINYFERNGGRPCGPSENPAEYILEVIGAGATARADQDWHEVWKNSNEAQQVQKEIEEIHAEGRSRPPPPAAQKTKYATTWFYQFYSLLKRDMEAHWREPTYILAKIGLNITAGLFIGFTFFKSKDTLQGTQNKLFSIFMSTVISVALANQLQVPFIHMREIYEIRERPSRMYSWTALITAQIVAELPWNIFASSLFFLCWFWTVGYATDRAGYTYLMMSVSNPLYYTTIGQAVAAMSPNAEIAALLFSLIFSFVITFNGVLQPFRALGWWRWMYRVSPYTYLIEGILGQAIGHKPIQCSAVEYVSVDPPSGQSCAQYLNPFINNAGGYLTNPDATSACQYCAFATTDQYLLTNFNIQYSHHWRNFGLFWVFIGFNIASIYFFMYVFRIQKTAIAGAIKRHIGGISGLFRRRK